MYCDSMCRLVVIDPGNVCCTISSLQICYLLACSILVIGRYLYSVVSVNRNIVIYNKYIVVVTVVVVFVSYCYHITSHHIETTDAGLDGLCIREINVYHTNL